ncbi:MAG: hypothetical protein ACYCW6_21125 [Candidatus Xenobia bacterium]
MSAPDRTGVPPASEVALLGLLPVAIAFPPEAEPATGETELADWLFPPSDAGAGGALPMLLPEAALLLGAGEL